MNFFVYKFFYVVCLIIFTVLCCLAYKKRKILRNSSGDLINIFDVSNISFKVLDNKKIYYLLVFIGFIIAIFVRVFKFGDMPGSFNQDGALSAIEAKSLLMYGEDLAGMSWPVHFDAWSSAQMSSLMAYFQIISVKFFGMTALGVRLPSLIISLIGLLCIFLFAKNAFNKYMGLIVLFFTAISPWHMMQSRWALEANLYPHFTIIAMFLLYMSITYNSDTRKSRILRYVYMVSSMFVFGLSMYAYGVSIYTTPVLLILLSIFLIRSKHVTIREVILCIISYLFIAWPFIMTMAINYFELDSIQVGIFTIPYFPNSERAADILLFTDDFIESFFINISCTFFTFVLQYDGNTYNAMFGSGIIYVFTIPFMIVGLICIFKYFRKHVGIMFIFSLFISSIVCCILTNDVNINRSNIAHYGLILMSCVGIYCVCCILKNCCVKNIIILIYSIAFLGFTCFYFIAYADHVSWRFHKYAQDTLTYVKNLDVDNYHIVALDKDTFEYLDLHEVYAIFYHDLDPKYVRNLEPDEDGRYYKDKYHYHFIGELTIDDITSGAYIVSRKDIDVFENYPDCEIIEFNGIYVVIVP